MVICTSTPNLGKADEKNWLNVTKIDDESDDTHGESLCHACHIHTSDIENSGFGRIGFSCERREQEQLDSDCRTSNSKYARTV